LDSEWFQSGHKNRHMHELLREACIELCYEMLLMVKNLWRGAVTDQRNTLSISREFLDSSTEESSPPENRTTSSVSRAMIECW
jgi:hypothetical protein